MACIGTRRISRNNKKKLPQSCAIENIITRRIIDQDGDKVFYQYLIKWSNHSHDFNTWEPGTLIDDINLLLPYIQNHPIFYSVHEYNPSEPVNSVHESIPCCSVNVVHENNPSLSNSPKSMNKIPPPSPQNPSPLSTATTQYLNVPSNNSNIFRSQSLRSVPRRKPLESQFIPKRESSDLNKENSPMNRAVIARSLSTKSDDHRGNSFISQYKKTKKISKNISKDKSVISTSISQGVMGNIASNEGLEGRELSSSNPVVIHTPPEWDNSNFENEKERKKEISSPNPMTPDHLPPLPEIGPLSPAPALRVKIQRSQSIHHRNRTKDPKRQFSSDRKSTHKPKPSKHRSQSFSQSSRSIPKSVRPTNLRRCTTTNNVHNQRMRQRCSTVSSVPMERIPLVSTNSNLPSRGGTTVAHSVRWKLAQDKMNQRVYEERRRKRLSLL